MVLDKDHEEKIIAAVRQVAKSVDFGEVRILLNRNAPDLEIIIETQEKIRIKKGLTRKGALV